MPNTETAHRVLRISMMALDALKAIGDLTNGVIKSKAALKAMEAVHVINAIVASIDKGLDGKVSLEQVEKDLSAFLIGVAKNDALADAAVDAKFPQGSD